ncbi:hypothetical protein RFI_20293, partial [Reticulomyxa filosa]
SAIVHMLFLKGINDTRVEDLSNFDAKTERINLRKHEMLLRGENKQKCMQWFSYLYHQLGWKEPLLTQQVMTNLVLWSGVHNLNAMDQLLQNELRILPEHFSFLQTRVDHNIIGALLQNMHFFHANSDDANASPQTTSSTSLLDGLKLFYQALEKYKDSFVPDINCFNHFIILYFFFSSPPPLKIIH